MLCCEIYSDEGKERDRCWLVVEGAEMAKTVLYMSPSLFGLGVTVEEKPTRWISYPSR
jgi:hypothetical protein